MTTRWETPTAKSIDDKTEEKPYHVEVHLQMIKDIRNVLFVYRFLNAISIATFFQPDEYYQALEPAWQLAFGEGSGAWMTWEWQHQLRSSLHPALFAVIYFIAGKIMSAVSLFPQFQGIIYTMLPRAVQSVFAAAGDFYTWRLAEKIYGEGSNTAWFALLMTIFNPWQWFCSTRTLSNSLETTLTIIALYHWPWAMAGDVASNEKSKEVKASIFRDSKVVNELRICLTLAGIASILRPTNLLIWLALATMTVTRLGLSGRTRATNGDLLVLVREVIFCGSIVIGISALSDYLYYGVWTFPPYQWLHFNITQSLAVFYGANRWDYYLTEGLPLLLTSYLPFSLYDIYSASNPSPTSAPLVANARFILAFIVSTTVTTLSLISHKEVRFIYPLLPILHVLAAPHFYAFFAAIPSAKALTPAVRQNSYKLSSSRSPILYAILVINIAIAGYTTQFHQRGVVSVTSFLRYEYEEIHLSQRGLLDEEAMKKTYDDKFPSRHDFSAGGPDELFAAFLMPCHSTPWRSNLVHPSLRAWALTCEPPLDVPAGSIERQTYRDEADRFFDDPVKFLREEVGGKERPWPRYVVGFEGIEGSLKEYYEEAMPGYRVKRKWEAFNSHWHDDWRRRGKVVVWEFLEPSKI